MPSTQSPTDSLKPRLRGHMYLRAEQRHQAEADAAATELIEIQTPPAPAVYSTAPAVREPLTATPASDAPAPNEWSPTVESATVPVDAPAPMRPLPRTAPRMSRRRALIPVATLAAVAVGAAMAIIAMLWPAPAGEAARPSAPQAATATAGSPRASQIPTATPAAAPTQLAKATPVAVPTPDVSAPTTARTTPPAAVPAPATQPAVQRVARTARPVAPRTESTMPVSTGSEGQLRVTSTPSGARVTVNGIGWGQTPVMIGHLPLGTKTVRVTYDGYASQQRIVNVRGDQPGAIHVTLPRAAAR